MYVFSGGEETELISRSDVMRYRRAQEQVSSAQPEIINSESTSIFTMSLYLRIHAFLLRNACYKLCCELQSHNSVFISRIFYFILLRIARK